MLRRLILVLILGFPAAAALWAQVEEYRVKAFFLYNFTRYVEWPPEAFKSANDPIVICILGESPFGDAMEEAIRGKEVAGRRLAVRSITGAPAGYPCHVLFVAAGEEKRFRTLAGTLRQSPVLTVGETGGFASEGGVINFKLEDGKLRFEINPETAAKDHLRISSKLLNLAQIVGK
jgi:hypothetical protein